MSNARSVDINLDAGESFGTWTKGNDEELLKFVSSVNVACGFHAGDPTTMLNTVRLAKAAGVTIGAHPSFRDLIGFGRRKIEVAPEDVFAEVVYQVGALAGLLQSEGLELHHVSPHGALGWATWQSKEVAGAVTDATMVFGEHVSIVALANTAIEEVASSRGIRIVRLGFPERGYLSNGRLAPRGTAGAVITDPQEAAARAVSMMESNSIDAVDGSRIDIKVDSLLIHGDNPRAPEIAQAVNGALRAAGITVSPF